MGCKEDSHHSGKYGKYTIPLAVCESGKIYSNMIIKEVILLLPAVKRIIAHIKYG